MPSRRRSRFQQLTICAVLALVNLGAPHVHGGDPAAASEAGAPVRLEVYETTVTVRATVSCRKYEGRVLHCTVNPLRAVKEVLDANLVLGYAGIQVGGDEYDAEPEAGAAVRLYPRGEGPRKDLSGEQEMKIRVVYAN